MFFLNITVNFYRNKKTNQILATQVTGNFIMMNIALTQTYITSLFRYIKINYVLFYTVN